MPIQKIDQEKCDGCGICYDGCPMDVIGFDSTKRKAYIKYPKECIVCFNCEQDCPVGAIYVESQKGTRIQPAW